MIDIIYQKKFLKINQLWYLGEYSVSELLKQGRRADILFVHGVREEEANGSFRKKQEFHSCINDLTIPEEELLKGIHKNVRYEIRRSEKDDVEVRFYTAKDVLEDRKLLNVFADIYEKMYRSKGMNTTLNLTTIQKYLEVNGIFFSTIYYQGELAIFHSYICDEREVRLLHSASCFRDEDTDPNLIGRANKRLHWDDMKYFKESNYTEYDWGGISDLENPNGIDAFKLKFGGEKITYYNVYAGNTILGKLAVWAMKMLKG